MTSIKITYPEELLAQRVKELEAEVEHLDGKLLRLEVNADIRINDLERALRKIAWIDADGSKPAAAMCSIAMAALGWEELPNDC